MNELLGAKQFGERISKPAQGFGLRELAYIVFTVVDGEGVAAVGYKPRSEKQVEGAGVCRQGFPLHYMMCMLRWSPLPQHSSFRLRINLCNCC